ncbi:MAG TPA: DUF1326 domain-containing protein [Burkholderiales bacterium]|nr:DUF1326 domain-containing protein [Burkholderiales bacterium]
MAHVDWLIVGKSFGNCNCDYGCSCQFESRPTHGDCRGTEFDIAEIGSGSATTAGAIMFTLKDSYGQFNRLRHNGGGVIRRGVYKPQRRSAWLIPTG